MQSIDKVHHGSLAVQGPMLITGIVNGTITVFADADLTLSGICNGDVIVQTGGAVMLTGILNGNVANSGALDVRGIVHGQVLNSAAGRFQRAHDAVITGGVRKV